MKNIISLAPGEAREAPRAAEEPEYSMDVDSANEPDVGDVVMSVLNDEYGSEHSDDDGDGLRKGITGGDSDVHVQAPHIRLMAEAIGRLAASVTVQKEASTDTTRDLYNDFEAQVHDI